MQIGNVSDKINVTWIFITMKYNTIFNWHRRYPLYTSQKLLWSCLHKPTQSCFTVVTPTSVGIYEGGMKTYTSTVWFLTSLDSLHIFSLIFGARVLWIFEGEALLTKAEQRSSYTPKHQKSRRNIYFHNRHGVSAKETLSCCLIFFAHN